MTRAVVKKRKRAPHLAGEHEYNDEEDDGGENDDDPSTGGCIVLAVGQSMHGEGRTRRGVPPRDVTLPFLLTSSSRTH